MDEPRNRAERRRIMRTREGREAMLNKAARSVADAAKELLLSIVTEGPETLEDRLEAVVKLEATLGLMDIHLFPSDVERIQGLARDPMPLDKGVAWVAWCRLERRPPS